MIKVVFNCFNNPKVMNRQMEAFYDLTDLSDLNYSFLLTWPRYPLPSIEEGRANFLECLAKYGVAGWEYENQGQTRNFNQIARHIEAEMSPRDTLAFWEPDCRPSNRSWLKASVAVLGDTSFHPVGFVTPHRMPAWVYGNQGRDLCLAGYHGKQITWPGGFPMGIYSWDFVKDLQSMKESYAYYGGTELDICSSLNYCNRVGFMFRDIEDQMSVVDSDPEYIAWKVETIRLPSEQQKDFSVWLRERYTP